MLQILTNTANGQKSGRILWRLTIGKERFHDVDTEGQSHYGLRARSDNHALDPETDKGHKRSKCHHNIGVIRPRLGNHCAKFSITVGANLNQK